MRPSGTDFVLSRIWFSVALKAVALSSSSNENLFLERANSLAQKAMRVQSRAVDELKRNVQQKSIDGCDGNFCSKI